MIARVLSESYLSSLLGFYTLLILCFFPVFALGPWVACGKVALFFLKTSKVGRKEVYASINGNHLFSHVNFVLNFICILA